MRIACASLLLLVLALPVMVKAQFTYATNKGTISITEYTGPGGAVAIPDATNGLPVTSIGDNAFKFSNLTSTTIPNSVTVIGSTAFEFCPGLTNVTIGNGVTSIGDYAFDDCGLTSITIPGSVTNIGNGAFSDSIGLKVITVDPLNSVYASVAGVLFNKSQTALIQYPAHRAGAYTIPNGVTNVGDHAFLDCTSLTSVEIPNGVTSIGSDAFWWCLSLTSVKIPNSVTSLGDYAFWWCTSLTNVTVGNSVTSIGPGTFINCGGLTSVIIPDSVTGIGNSAFQSCHSLTNVTIGNRVTDIGDAAFAYSSLTSITIPNSVTTIGNQSFASCPSLTGVYFAGNAPSIDATAFQDDNQVLFYYLPGTTGWGATLDGRPAAPWVLSNPLILDNSVGVKTNRFGFVISWATNASVAVEASTDLANPTWSQVGTNTLTSGSSYFSDAQWTNYPSRFYRLRSP